MNVPNAPDLDMPHFLAGTLDCAFGIGQGCPVEESQVYIARVGRQVAYISILLKSGIPTLDSLTDAIDCSQYNLPESLDYPI